MADGDITIILDLRGNDDVDRRLRGTAGEADRLGRAADTAGRKGSAMGQMFSGAARAVGAIGLAVGAAAAAVGAATLSIGYSLAQQASDAAETRSAFETVFAGEPLGDINGYVEEMNDRFGIATTMLRESALTFGTFGQAAGIAQADLDDFSSSLISAGLDMASFHNANPEDVFAALRSGLSGEAEPLRQFGIFLSDAALNAYAMAQGINTSVSEMSEGEKVALRQAYILDNLGAAQGDLERTSESLSNQQRRLSGIWQDQKETIGATLLPILGALVSVVADLAARHLPRVAAGLESMLPAGEAVEKTLRRVISRTESLIALASKEGLTEALVSIFGEGARPIIDGIAATLADVIDIVGALWDGFVEGGRILRELIPSFRTPLELLRTGISWLADNTDLVTTFGTVLGTIVPVLGLVTVATRLWGVAMAMNPVGLVIIAIGALVAGLVRAYQTSETFRARVDAVWQWLQQAAGWLRSNVLEPLVGWWVGTMWPSLQAAVEAAWPVLQQIMANIGGTFSAVWTGILQPMVGWFQENWPRIAAIAGEVGDAIAPIVEFIAQAHRQLWHDVLQPMLAFWMDELWPGINRAIENAGPIVTGILDAILNHVEWLMEGVQTAKTGITEFWTNLTTRAQEAWETVQGIIRQIREGFDSIRDLPGNVIGSVTSRIPGLATGGPALAGAPYRVGEQGPELFVPATSGWVFSARQTAAMTPQVADATVRTAVVRGGDGDTAPSGETHVHIHVAASALPQTRADARRLARELVPHIDRTVGRDGEVG